VEQQFTSSQVMAQTGITARQLQWWDERGLVVPLKQGHRRLYSLDDVAEIAVICDLRRRGFSLQRVRRVIRFLQKEFGKRLVETVSGASDYHLLTDGKRLLLETSPQQVIDILKNSRQPMFTICLSDTVRQVRAELAPREAPRRSLAGAPRGRPRKAVRSDSGARRLRVRRIS
jgi:DNA-binding transcriptional MerR regulator